MLFEEIFKRSSKGGVGASKGKRTLRSGPSAKAMPEAVRKVARDRSRRMGKYIKTKFIGQGGMGGVWKAWDTELGRWVALKILRHDDPAELARFKREAQTAASIAHPNIATVYEASEVDGKAYIAMQYIEGHTLRTFPRDNVRLIAELIRDAATALHAAHEQGVIHRDIKPENLMVGGKGGVVTRSRTIHAQSRRHLYILDFGLAKQTAVESTISMSGSILGTPWYMSPQQARGRKDLDYRTDIYSLGAVFYELIADRPPFDDPNMYELLKKIVEQPSPPLRRLKPRVSRDLSTIVMKCLEKDPERRYSTAQDLADDLTRWLTGKKVRAAAGSRKTPRKGDSRNFTPKGVKMWAERVDRHQSVLLELAKLDHADINASFRRITEATARTLNVSRVGIWLFSDRGTELVCHDLYRLGSDVHERGLSLVVAKYPRYFRAQDQNRVVAAEDAVKDPNTSEFAEEYLKPLDIRSMMDVPIRVRGRLRGVVCQESVGRQRPWTLEEQQFVSSIADIVAIALEASDRQRAEQELETREERIRRHQDVLLKLAKLDTSSLKSAFRTMTEATARMLGVERASIWLFNEKGTELVLQDLYRLGGDAHETGLKLQVAKYPAYFGAQEESRVVNADDAVTDPRTAEFAEDYLRPLGIISMMDVAIRVRGKLLGVVCHESVGSRRNWTIEEQQFVSSVADLVALAIGSAEPAKRPRKKKAASGRRRRR